MAFASIDDIRARRGMGDLSTAQSEQATYLLAAASSSIAEACGKDDDWASALSPVPRVVRTVCVEAVCRAMANPEGLSSDREQLGAHSYGRSFREVGVDLTDREERMVRRAVFGGGSAAATVRSITDDLWGS